MLTVDLLRQILAYDRITGIFTWKVRDGVPAWWNTKYAGQQAGSEDADGYWVIRINSKTYKAHRLAWAYVTGEIPPPETEVDHIDGRRKLNAFNNLRLVDDVKNAVNAKRRSDNRSGLKGVSWHRRIGKWQAQINDNGKRKALGYFDSAEAAHKAYQVRAFELHGEFMRL